MCIIMPLNVNEMELKGPMWTTCDLLEGSKKKKKKEGGGEVEIKT